MVLFYKNF